MEMLYESTESVPGARGFFSWPDWLFFNPSPQIVPLEANTGVSASQVTAVAAVDDVAPTAPSNSPAPNATVPVEPPPGHRDLS